MNAVPALVISGFLGSGKTTLVDRLLRRAQRDGVRLAIVSNEFGDTGIDKALLDRGEDGLVELDGGCVCCRLSDALAETLVALLDRVTPDRLVLETSGLALPADVLAQFWRRPLRDRFSDVRAVVVVDAERAAAAGDPDPTWTNQLEAADVVVLNKIDLVDADGLARARAAIDAITGGRPILPALRCDVDPAALSEAFAGRRDPDPHDHDHGDHDHAEHEALHARYGTEERRYPDGVDPEAVARELAALGALRCKGFVRGPDGVVTVVQGVGARVELVPAPRPVPPELVGVVVVIRDGAAAKGGG